LKHEKDDIFADYIGYKGIARSFNVKINLKFGLYFYNTICKINRTFNFIRNEIQF